MPEQSTPEPEQSPPATGPAPPILKYFAYEHLPPHLRVISKPFAELAERVVSTVPNGPELSAGLRKLLEAKDCIVRAALP